MLELLCKVRDSNRFEKLKNSQQGFAISTAEKIELEDLEVNTQPEPVVVPPIKKPTYAYNKKPCVKCGGTDRHKPTRPGSKLGNCRPCEVARSKAYWAKVIEGRHTYKSGSPKLGEYVTAYRYGYNAKQYAENPYCINSQVGLRCAWADGNSNRRT